MPESVVPKTVELTTQVVPQEQTADDQKEGGFLEKYLSNGHKQSTDTPLCDVTHFYMTKKRVFKKPVKVLGTIKRKEDDTVQCLFFPGTCWMVGAFYFSSSECNSKKILWLFFFQNLWDIVLAFLLVYTLIVLPLRLAFKVMDYPQLDYTIDALFITDIIINFNTPFEDLEQRYLVTNRKRIACTYLKGWFLIDLISSFPFYIFSGDR